MKRSARGRVGGTLFLILSALVAVSMICGTILAIVPSPERRAPPTATPTVQGLTPSDVTPSPSPPAVTPTLVPAVAPSPVPQPTS